MGLDLHADEVGRARKMIFAPGVVEQERGDTAVELSTEPAEPGAQVSSTMPGVFRARSVVTNSGTFGHVRIFTFSVEDPDAFVAEFVRLVGLLPEAGLILDVRGNGADTSIASEFTLQTLTPRQITPAPLQFATTSLNLAICRQHATNPTQQIDLGPWFASMEQSVETGAAYSSAFAITLAEGANAIGQRYVGPVVLVTDARCGSARSPEHPWRTSGSGRTCGTTSPAATCSPATSTCSTGPGSCSPRRRSAGWPRRRPWTPTGP